MPNGSVYSKGLPVQDVEESEKPPADPPEGTYEHALIRVAEEKAGKVTPYPPSAHDDYWAAPPMEKFEKGSLLRQMKKCQERAAKIPQWRKDMAPPLDSPEDHRWYDEYRGIC